MLLYSTTALCPFWHVLLGDKEKARLLAETEPALLYY